MSSQVIISLCFIIQSYHYYFVIKVSWLQLLRALQVGSCVPFFSRTLLLSGNNNIFQAHLVYYFTFFISPKITKFPSFKKRLFVYFFVSSPLGNPLHEVMFHFICPKLLFLSCKSFQLGLVFENLVEKMPVN